MSIFFESVIVIALLGIALSLYNYRRVMAVPEGTDEMISIAKKIRSGANVFLIQEYKVLIPIVLVLFAFFLFIVYPQSGLSFLIGAFLSGFVGWYGMQMSTRANVRVTNTARETLNIGKTLQVAFQGGSVMGMAVHGFALFGIAIVMLINRALWNDLTVSVVNIFGIQISPLPIILSQYSLGCSIIALFNRVGGGIYTKAADMGSDLVGKTELNLDEDDARNPGTIADGVGDNVGDTAGLGSDLLESFVATIVSAIIIAIHDFSILGLSSELLNNLIMYPVILPSLGFIACIVANLYMCNKKMSDDPHKELNVATWLSAGLTAVFGLIATIIFFNGKDLGELPFILGPISPWISELTGIVGGVAIGLISEYYTSNKSHPTQTIADASKEGTALTITQGLAVGMNSILPSVIVLGLSLLIASAISGTYGTAIAAVGMLSFVGMTVSVDTYGPIADNAGGIAEMAHLDKEVRAITDELDSVGNTTAAVGKGFAIGSASLATVVLMISYLYAFTPVGEDIVLNGLDAVVLAGILIGGGIIWKVSGMLIESVSKAARKMVDVIRHQFETIPGLAEGQDGVEPDYNECIEVSTKGSLSEMSKPALITILTPIISGLLFGTEFIAGILLGAIISAIMLAIFCGNSGGAWDNSKKYIESLGLKGKPVHISSVVGDTVGDPLKDTVGPSLDIIIKFMATISQTLAPFFVTFNLLNLLSSFF